MTFGLLKYGGIENEIAHLQIASSLCRATISGSESYAGKSNDTQVERNTQYQMPKIVEPSIGIPRYAVRAT